MARVKRGVTKHAKHKKVIKMAKGYRGRNKNVVTVAREKVEKGLKYQYRDRRKRKNDARALWIIRINAAVRPQGMVYSKFMNGLLKAGIKVDRKMLADLALNNPTEFKVLVDQSKKALEAK